MAAPLQYQSQFVPTNFNVTGNVLGMLRQDMQQRNQEFDQGVAIQNQALANLYGLKTYDQDVINQSADTLKQKIEALVGKKGKDYGAAANEIAGLIAQERKNPIYGLNARKVEQVQALEQALARNPNLRVLQDPRKQALNANMLPEDIGYSVADPASIQESINAIYGSLGKQTREGDLEKSGTPGYLQAVTTKGLTEKELGKMMGDPEVMNAILARNPQLQSYMQDPETAKWFTNQVTQGMKGLVGGQQKQFVRDYDYDNRKGPELTESYDNVLNQSGYSLVPNSINDLGTSVFKEMGDKAAIKEAEALGIPGVKTFKDLQKMAEAGLVTDPSISTTDPIYGVEIAGKKYEAKSPYYDLAIKAINNIEAKIGTEEFGTGIPTYNIETLASASKKSITELEGIQQGFNDAVVRRKDKFEAMSKEDRKEFESITKDFDILDVSPNFQKDRAGMVLFVQGKDDDGELRKARIYLKPEEQNYEKTLMKFLNDMNPVISKEYFYAKEGEDFLNYLEDKKADLDTSSRTSIDRFIKEKREGKKN